MLFVAVLSLLKKKLVHINFHLLAHVFELIIAHGNTSRKRDKLKQINW